MFPEEHDHHEATVSSNLYEKPSTNLREYPPPDLDFAVYRAGEKFPFFFFTALAFDRDLGYNITVKLKCLFQAGVWA